MREIGKTNRGKEIDAWQRAAGTFALGSYWCSWFVSAGLRAVGVKTAYFGRARSWFDSTHAIWRRGAGLPGKPPPQPYDLVGYAWNPGEPGAISHVGFVVLWGVSATAKTCEGNTGGGVLSRDGDGVYLNWRPKRLMAAVANVIDNPRYTHSE